MEKYKKVKQTLQKTKERRASKVCKVYEVKVDKSVLSKEKFNYLYRLFLEAKWWYNYVLSQPNIFKIDLKIKKISVMNKDKRFEERELRCLSYSMKNEVHKRILTCIKSLSTKKKKNKKVGRLRFLSALSSIPGKIYIKNNNFIRIEGLKKCFRVIGLKQIPQDSEIANIMLIRKNSNFYFHITTFQNKQKIIKTNQSIAIDLGIENSLNFSNGIKIDVNLKETKRIKRLQQKLSRQQKNSKNKFRTRLRLQSSYEKRDNQKEDITNKIVSYLNNNFDDICIQNDCVAGWQRKYGRKINSSIVGRTLAKLKYLPKTTIVDRFYPSTQLCPACDTKTKLTLKDRVYKCKNCGFTEDRDTKSARMIELEGLKSKNIPMEYGNFKLVENESSTCMLEYFKNIRNMQASSFNKARS
jgi:putative transposase